MVVNYGAAGVEPGDQRLPAGVGVAEVQKVQAVAIGASGGIEDEVFLVLGGVGEVVPVGFVLIAVDEAVLGLVRPNFVVVHAVEGVLCTQFTALRCRIAAVVKPVADPARAGELHPAQDIPLGRARGQVVHMNFLPVGARFVLNHGDVAVVVARATEGCRNGTVLAQCIRIEEELVLAVQCFAHVPNALVLQSIVLRKEVPVADFPWHPDFFIIEKRFKTITQRLAPVQAVQVALGALDLFIHPSHGFFGAVVFQPPIRVRDLNAPQGVFDVFGAGLRIVHGAVHRGGRSLAIGEEERGAQCRSNGSKASE